MKIYVLRAEQVWTYRTRFYCRTMFLISVDHIHELMYNVFYCIFVSCLNILFVFWYFYATFLKNIVIHSWIGRKSFVVSLSFIFHFYINYFQNHWLCGHFSGCCGQRVNVLTEHVHAT